MSTIEGKWVFKGDNSIGTPITISSISFNSNNTQYNSIDFNYGGEFGGIIGYYGSTPVYDQVGGTLSKGDWQNEAYRTVDFGTTEQTVSDAFLTWMQANATPEADPTPTDAVTIEYNGTVIASLKAGQSATVECEGKTMHTDVVVSVPDGLGGGGSDGEAEFNIAYGNTAPTDTSKLWVKTAEPTAVEVTAKPVFGDKTLESGISALPTALGAIASAKVGTKVYLFGGSRGEIYPTEIKVFDTETNTISTLDASIPKGASYIAAAAVGTKIYLFGGFYGYISPDSILSTINVFDTETNTISTLSAKLPSGTGYIAAAAVGTKIYLFGGYTSFTINKAEYLDRINVFDTETNTISTLDTKLPTAARGIAASAVGDKVYLFGGSIADGYSSTINVFDTKTYTIKTLTTTLPSTSYNMPAAAVGTKIYLFGGFNGANLSTINEFDTTVNTITTLTTNIPTAASAITASVIGGKIYLFGGFVSGATLSQINVFIITLPLTANNLLIDASGSNNLFNLLPNVELGVNSVYLGNAEGNGELVEAALYKDGVWADI